MLALTIFVLLKLVAKCDENGKQVLWRACQGKIKRSIGENCPSIRQTAPVDTQVFDQGTFAAASRSNKGQDRKQWPGDIWVWSTELVKESNGFVAVRKGLQLAFWHTTSALSTFSGKDHTWRCTRV